MKWANLYEKKYEYLGRQTAKNLEFLHRKIFEMGKCIRNNTWQQSKILWMVETRFIGHRASCFVHSIKQWTGYEQSAISWTSRMFAFLSYFLDEYPKTYFDYYFPFDIFFECHGVRMLQLLFEFKIWQRFQITMSNVEHWALNIKHIPFHRWKLRTIENSQNNRTTDGSVLLSSFHIPYRARVTEAERGQYSFIWFANSIEIFLFFWPHTKLFRLSKCRLISKVVSFSFIDSFFMFCLPIDNANSTKCNSFLPNGDYSKSIWKNVLDERV